MRNRAMTNYDKEVKERFGSTGAYKEFQDKTANYTKDALQNVNDGLMSIFAEFAECKKSGNAADSAEAQALVGKLQAYITKNYYTCINEILRGFGAMYTADERFKENIDKCGEGTAEFTSEAISVFCKPAEK